MMSPARFFDQPSLGCWDDQRRHFSAKAGCFDGSLFEDIETAEHEE